MFETYSFPDKLRTMLQDANSLGFDDIVAWQPGGESFKIVDYDRFASEIMQKYFSQTRKLKSFQRQLNVYGFRRVHQGPNKGGYSHPLFNEFNPHMSEGIVRTASSKRNAKKCKTFVATSNDQSLNKSVVDVKSASDFGLDMFKKNNDFLPMPAVPTMKKSSREKIQPEYSEIPLLHDIFYPEDPTEQKIISSLFFDSNDDDIELFNDDKTSDIQNLAPVAEMSVESELNNLLALLQDDNTSMESSEQEDKEATEEEFASQNTNMDHIFPFKLHSVLEDAEKYGFSHIISWVKGGHSFRVHDHRAFVEQIMPNYFDQTKYESFRRQLNLYGFIRVSRGEDRGMVSHSCFVRGDRSLCHYIIRQPFKGAFLL